MDMAWPGALTIGNSASRDFAVMTLHMGRTQGLSDTRSLVRDRG